VLPFYSINSLYYTVLGPLSQNGIDMPPTTAMIHTWESSCKEFTATTAAWKVMLSTELVDFNSLLTRNNLQPLKIVPTAVTAPPACKFTVDARK
jgi:hypothetical protein